jgi:hypothetical protein
VNDSTSEFLMNHDIFSSGDTFPVGCTQEIVWAVLSCLIMTSLHQKSVLNLRTICCNLISEPYVATYLMTVPAEKEKAHRGRPAGSNRGSSALEHKSVAGGSISEDVRA